MTQDTKKHSPKVINESELEQQALCPLFDPPAVSDLEKAVIQTVAVSVLRAFQGKPLSLKDIHQKFVDSWKREFFKESPPPTLPISGPYWDGPKRAGRVGNIILTLLAKYDVVQPIQPYELTMNGYTIQGRYGILRRRVKDGFYGALTMTSKPTLYREFPAPVDLVRHIHLTRTHDYAKIGMVYVPTLRGPMWSRKHVDYKLAEAWVEGILPRIGSVTVNPGSHCRLCVSRKCMQIFDERQDDYSRIRRLSQIHSGE